VFRSSFFSQVFLSQDFSLKVGVGKIYLGHGGRQFVPTIEVSPNIKCLFHIPIPCIYTFPLMYFEIKQNLVIINDSILTLNNLIEISQFIVTESVTLCGHDFLIIMIILL